MPRRKGLRTGYTTGTCAAAAAKAATLALVCQEAADKVEVRLPSGQPIVLPVHTVAVEGDRAWASVTKDAGDDPDITHGAEVWAQVTRGSEPGIVLERGEGVGVVTKPGLGLPIGAPAITEVPRRMIVEAVTEVLDSCGDAGSLAQSIPQAPSLRDVGSVAQASSLREGPVSRSASRDEASFRGVSRRGEACLVPTKEVGLIVTIGVRDGERLAQKTLNPRLGIMGGLSILGTTGIVVPYSTSAYKVCIRKALDVAVAAGCRQVVLTTGARSERFARGMADLPEEAFIQMGDFAGYALRCCARRPLEKVTVVGFVGKLSKIAAGHEQTHVGRSQVEMRFLAQVAAEGGVPASVLEQAEQANTARHFLEIVEQYGGAGVPERLCALAAARMSSLLGPGKSADCAMVDFDGRLLGRAEVVG